MTRPPLEIANSAALAANRQRAAALLAILDAESPIGVTGVICAACTTSGRPLRRITLRQLLLAQPGWGSDRARKVLEQMTDTLGVENVDLRRLTIAWLLDPRAGGTRFMAFCDALRPRAAGSWTGYPFGPKTRAIRDTRIR